MVSFQAQTAVPADTSEIKADKEMSNRVSQPNKHLPQTHSIPPGRLTVVVQPSGVYHVMYAVNYCFDIHTDRTPCRSAWERKTTSIAVPSFKAELQSRRTRKPPTVTFTHCLTHDSQETGKIPSDCTFMNLQAIFNWDRIIQSNSSYRKNTNKL